MSSDETLMAIVMCLTAVMGMVASRTDFNENVTQGDGRDLRRWTIGTNPEASALGSGFTLLALWVWPGPFGELPGFALAGRALLESISAFGFLQWLLLVLKTAPDTSWLRPPLRAAQIVVVVHALAVIAGYQVIAALTIVAATALGTHATYVLMRSTSSERLRLKGLVIALPLFAAAILLGPKPLSAGLISAGTAAFLIGAGQFFVNEGRRMEFMGRFLSSQVRSQVREQGMTKALQQAQYEISIIFCDLRGFTAFSQAHSSNEVVGVLKRYYDAVSTVVAGLEATIKDFAGDGIVVLVGAPLPVKDHATRALELARRARVAAKSAIEPWSGAPDHLGMGIGVATGVVTVGVIEAVSRLEYTAIGAAVNLAARLCSAAKDGEIRVDQRTVELAGARDVSALPDVSLKGYAEPVPNFLLATSQA